MAGLSSLLVRGAAMSDPARARTLFERAVALESDLALPWLWLALATEAPAIADERIKLALQRDFGPLMWHRASGELLLALGIRRASTHLSVARATVLDASLGIRGDPRIWLVMAAITLTPENQLPYLERAQCDAGALHPEVRAELLHAALNAAHTALRGGRRADASRLLVRVARQLPADAHCWTLAAMLASSRLHAEQILFEAAQIVPENREQTQRVWEAFLPPDSWWARASGNPAEDAPDSAVLHRAFIEWRATLPASVLPTYRSPRFAAALRQSAARWTARWNHDARDRESVAAT
jgi:hypothetical protein